MSSLFCNKLHNFEDRSEQQRVEKLGGVIEPLRDENGKFYGPPRVWQKGKTGPGLVASRIFGDKMAQEVGVDCCPTVNFHKLERGKYLLVIASDGL